MIALTHEPTMDLYLARNLRANAEAARFGGIRVHSMPIKLDDVESALGWIDYTEDPQLGVLSTYIQRIGSYRPLYEAAAGRGVRLLHTPEQTSRLMEFSLFYPLISDMTARSVVITDESSLMEAISTLQFPLFTKGQIKSVKEQGWDACVARTPGDLAHRAGRWGEVIAREILPLRQAGSAHEQFPHFREYRAYWLDGSIIGMGYYWDGEDGFGPLGQDAAEIERLVDAAARRLDAPFVTVDVGQLEDGSWRVIEIGDPQYSAICHMNRHLCWQALADYERKHLVAAAAPGALA